MHPTCHQSLDCNDSTKGKPITVGNTALCMALQQMPLIFTLQHMAYIFMIPFLYLYNISSFQNALFPPLLHLENSSSSFKAIAQMSVLCHIFPNHTGNINHILFSAAMATCVHWPQPGHSHQSGKSSLAPPLMCSPPPTMPMHPFTLTTLAERHLRFKCSLNVGMREGKEVAMGR